MTDPTIKYPEYSVPFFRTADVVLDATGGANSQGEIDPSDFTGQNIDTVVDKVLIFETTTRDPSNDPGADTFALGYIRGRWYMSQACPGILPEIPIPALDTGFIDRTMPMVHGPQEPYDFAIVSCDLRRSPIIVPADGALRCDWTNPTKTSAGAIPAGTLRMAAVCRVSSSRLPIILYLPISILASAGGGAAGPSATQYDVASSRNKWGAPLELQQLMFWIDGGYGSASNWDDLRTLRHLRVRPYIEPGEVDLGGGGVYFPVVGLGTGRQLDHAVATLDWSDEPVPVPSSDGLGFKFTNDGAYVTRVTVVQACRRRRQG